MLSSFQTFALSITTASNFSTPENTAKVIDLTADVAVRGDNSLDFAILSGADANKFTLKGNELTFEATDFEARSDVAYRVKTATSAVRSITLAVFSGVEKLEAVVIDNANVWNDDNNSILAINLPNG
jgi:hypothetical protein